MVIRQLKVLVNSDIGKEFFCDECHEPCTAKYIDQSFDYAGTHCTHGRPGTHHEYDILSDCCEAEYSDGKYYQCLECGAETELHPKADIKEVRCSTCGTTGEWTDNY